MGISEGYVSEPRIHSPARGSPNPKLNVLVDNSGRACLTGFSALTIAPDQSTTIPPLIFYDAPQFLSPELMVPTHFGLEHSRPTEKSDCYALGMVVYEVLSGRMPFSQDRPTAVGLRVLDGTRPRRPHGNAGKLFTDDIWGILELCWKHQPRDRISAKGVLLRLERITSPLRLGGDAETDTGNRLDDASGYSGRFFSSIPASPLIILAL